MRAAAGGGLVLIDPESLRRCAATLDNLAADFGVYAAGLRGVGLPSMPAPVAASVQGGIAAAAATLQAQSQLHDDAVELRARALWADFADAAGGGCALGGGELRQFVAGLEDGSLMRYAEPWQAQLAGIWVGDTYRRSFARDPAKLVELSRILAGSARDREFAVAFVERFGGSNLVQVPRVLQAMRWTNAIASPLSVPDPYADARLARALESKGYRSPDDPVSLLASFSMVLAVSTAAVDGQRANPLAAEEDEIAGSGDSWAVAQLLQGGQVFGRRFLVQVFQRQLIPLVRRDTTDYVADASPRATYPLGDHVPADAKQIILDAIARNPAAAAGALTQPLPEPVAFVTPYGPVESANPLDILVAGHWQDGGRAVGSVYGAAVGYLHGQDDPLAANTLTVNAVGHVLHGPQQLTGMTRAVASDLAQHHMGDLYRAAGAATGGDAVWVTPADDGHRLDLGVRALRDLIVRLDQDGPASTTFLDAAARHQAQLILANTHVPPSAATMAWVNDVSGFDTVVMNADGIHLQDQFDAANERHRLLFSFVGNVAGELAKAVPGGGAVTGPALDWLDHHTEPSQAVLAAQTGDANATTMHSMYGAIAQGYYANGVIPHEGVPRSLLVEPSDPRSPLKPYRSLQSNGEIGEYDVWLAHSPVVLAATNETTQTAAAKMLEVQTELGG